ncbi:MAG TPA: UvrD-helicase domain-containing protein, partial [Bacteroidia bacterium]|nr:UvrD-helicase domain-containing protein [Bacteroidia bacterium]
MNFTVYRSSAGSGKTFTLVREYLAIALSDTAFPPQRYKEILAITFTNKAAGEMKERIIRALKELSGKPAEISSPLSSALQEKLMLDPFTLAERAGNVLKAILHNYGDFAIGTIDSFTHRIVRAFAHDLSLPVNFEVETDEEKIISEAVDLLVSRIGKDEMLTEILYSFSESRTEDEKNWQIESDLRDISRQLLREDGADFASRLRDLTPENFMTIRKKLLTFIRQFESKVIALASELHQRFRDHGLEEEDFAHGKTGIAGRIRAFANGRLEKFGDGNKNVTKTLASGKFHSTKATAAKVAAINALVPEITSVFAQMDALQEKEFGDYILRGMMLKNIFALAVLNEIEKIIFSFRTEDNIIHISEFNRIISRVVAGEPAPFIYERLGERYRNYLIDEFQDTSVTQWHNLLPLIENALGGNNFTMVVGDSKQAIYRWRSGDVEQFARLPAVPSAQDSELLLQREASLKRNYREEKLGTNFRSKSEIVNFNNGFFRKLSEETGPYAEEIYRGIEQEFRKENAGGYVRIEAVPEEEERNANAVHLEKTITLIRDLLAEGFRHSDIAVLTRTNREGSETAKLLVENGIPVLSPDSLLLQHSAAVGFVVSILKIIENPSDEIATASVTEFLVRFGKTSGTYHENLAATTEPGGLAALCAANGIAFEPETLSRRPLYQRCEEIISVFGLSSSLDSYLLFFLDEVLSWSSSKSASRTDFFTWWDDRRQRASVV